MNAEAQLQMVACRLVALSVQYDDAALRADRWDDAYEVRANADWYATDEPQAWMVQLTLRLKPKPGTVARFTRANISVQGRFVVSVGPPDQQVTQLLVYNAPAMLHGLARGVLAQVTGLCVGGPLILPAVNYLQLFKRYIGRLKRQGKKEVSQAQGSHA